MKNFFLSGIFVLSFSSPLLAASQTPDFECKISQRLSNDHGGQDVTVYAQGDIAAIAQLQPGLVAHVPALFPQKKLKVELTLTTFNEDKYGVLADLQITSEDGRSLISSSSARYDLDAKNIDMEAGSMNNPSFFVSAECERK